MSAPGPAVERLLRLLHLIPAATREGGVAYDEIAGELGVSASTIVEDVRELLDRSAYLHASDAGQIFAELESDRVEIWEPGPFDRPPRLTRGEALALVLGLRSLALLRGRTPAHGTRLLDRLEGTLAEGPPNAAELPVEDASATASGAALRDRALDAVASGRTLELLYLKPGDEAPAPRRLEPAAVVHAEGRWYLVGRDPVDAASGARAFRFDRVLEISDTGERFAPETALETERAIEGSRLFIAPDDLEEVGVVYAPSIARWIRERYEGEELADGSYRVVHRVADREWLVRHVLQYAGAARAEGEAARWVRRTLDGEEG